MKISKLVLSVSFVAIAGAVTTASAALSKNKSASNSLGANATTETCAHQKSLERNAITNPAKVAASTTVQPGSSTSHDGTR